MLFEAAQMDCFSRVGLFHHLTQIVHHLTNFTLVVPAHKDLIVSQCAFFDDHCCCDLARLFINVRLNDQTLSIHREIFNQVYPFASNF